MKFLFPIILIALASYCKSPQQAGMVEMADSIISKTELANIIYTLSSDSLEGRRTGTEGIDKAAIYIEKYLKDSQIRPFFKQFRDSFDAYNAKGFNLIGLIEGSDPELKKEYIILSAHYDHIGKIKNAIDSVYNGANDNATGVSTVLNIAKILAALRNNRRSVIIALFSGEEIGLTGSNDFALKLKNNSSKVYCAVNIDMIGSVLTNQPNKVYLTGFQMSNMAEVFNRNTGNEPFVYWPGEKISGVFQMSDNYPIYQNLKVPAHTFCTFDFKNYEHYHRLTDEVDKIDMDNTLTIANNICIAVRKIAESKEKEIHLK